MNSLLHDQPVVWPKTPEDLEALSVFIGRQGMGPLLYHRFHGSSQWKDWPLFIQEVLEEDFHKSATSHLVLQKELDRVLDHLAQRNIFPFLMKGMPLSCLVYAAPNLRPFTDIDLLIHKKEIQSVKEAMVSLGYEVPNAVTGDLISHEFICEKTDIYGIHHAYDFHWKILNPLVFSEALSYEEIKRTALPVPLLGKHVNTLSLEHALFLACMHRVAHHAHEDRLIWIYDIHLLITRISKNGIHNFLELVRQKKVAAVCREGLLTAGQWFGTSFPEDFWGTFFTEEIKSELSAAYLEPGNIQWRNFTSNWKALRSPKDKLRLLFEYFFPSPDYMFKKYSTRPSFLLPFLYFCRGYSGLIRLFLIKRGKS